MGKMFDTAVELLEEEKRENTRLRKRIDNLEIAAETAAIVCRNAADLIESELSLGIGHAANLVNRLNWSAKELKKIGVGNE